MKVVQPPDKPAVEPGEPEVETEFAEGLVAVGRISAVHGIRGWLKIHSYTRPKDNIFTYQPWWLQVQGVWRRLQADQFQSIDKGFLAHLNGVNDRNEASLYRGLEILVEPQCFGKLASGELYWHQLQGLTVISTYGGGRHNLGRIESLLETGANDVLVVRGDCDSIDRRERLLPYTESHVGRIDLTRGELEIDWDPDF